ncbi:putative transposase-like protein [Trichonephila clavata]|uniref:Putative transposase-like protein n=1 Tax=Trichonephila clavata TaxID=2740835 RepID=A0A8X6HKI8_TRICU|nr:putative transposase-like protein [Trichonephila clavata]
MLECTEENLEQIGNKDNTVEIDKFKFIKRRYNRGHAVEGQWVFGGVERGTGKMFLVSMHDCNRYIDWLIQWIKPGTTIYSDCWKS